MFLNAFLLIRFTIILNIYENPSSSPSSRRRRPVLRPPSPPPPSLSLSPSLLSLFLSIPTEIFLAPSSGGKLAIKRVSLVSPPSLSLLSLFSSSSAYPSLHSLLEYIVWRPRLSGEINLREGLRKNLKTSPFSPLFEPKSMM